MLQKQNYLIKRILFSRILFYLEVKVLPYDEILILFSVFPHIIYGNLMREQNIAQQIDVT